MYAKLRAGFRYSLCILCFLLNGFLSTPLHPQERFRKNPPSPEPLPELKLPDIDSAILTNGLTLSVIQQEGLPLFGLQLIILAGESSSPKNLPGLATLTTQVMTKGAMNLSSSQFEEAIESIGGNFTSATYADFSVFTLFFLEEYLDKALDVFSQIILNPEFARIEIENVKRTMYYDLIGYLSDPEFLARRLLFSILFSGHAYRKMFYNYDVIKNLTRSAAVDFFNTYYRPNNAKLILTGNINLTTASRKVSHYFNTWKRKELEYRPIEPPKFNDKPKICFIDLPKSNETTIYIGNIISPSTSAGYFPWLVLNQVLGGTPNSRLFMNLRESKGYAYYAFSSIESFKACSVFYVRSRVRPEVISDSVKEILNEIRRIIKETIPSYEIEQAKSYLIGNYPLNIETQESLSFKLSEIQAFNLGQEHWNKYYESIMLIDSGKVFETAQKYPLLSSVVIIVGDKNDFIDHLSDFREIEVYDIQGNLKQILKPKGENE